jgi:membrane-bound lytic murein transglycosylase D
VLVLMPRRLTLALLLPLVVVALGSGCHTAVPKAPPAAPTPSSSPRAAATPTPTPATPADSGVTHAASPADASAVPNAAAGPAAAAPPPTPVEEAGTTEEEAPDNGPQATQKEALDLCQSASELLDARKTDEAVAALDRAYGLMLTLPQNGDDAYLQAKEDIRRLVADLIQKAYQTQRPAATPTTPSWDLALPIVENDYVRREILSFTTVERDQFLEAYRRSGLYRPMILAKLEAAQLPSQLAWLPLVESAFKGRALSRAGALGLWQFIASTGLRYGLSRDGWVDERLDPEKATDAAIAYLTELHRLFGDWPKALAAYNCGEARVYRRQTRPGEYFDFWDLYEQLPSETRRYVPRFIAALLIVENPGKYGMTLPQPLASADTLTAVRVERAVELEKLDVALGLEKGTLLGLNPELRSAATPPRAYELRVPADKGEAVAPAVAQLPAWTRPIPLYTVHRVRSGETLGLIARRYGTTAGAIQRANGLRSARSLRIGQRLRIPTRGSRP